MIDREGGGGVKGEERGTVVDKRHRETHEQQANIMCMYGTSYMCTCTHEHCIIRS